MTTAAERVLEQAMSLSSEEKGQVAAEMLRSIDSPSEIDAAWADETERRLGEFLAGCGGAAPLDEAIDQTRAWLKERRR
jgi:hypothetical protein